MPCWVVPSVASEMWQVPVDQILSAIKSGELPTRQENGFTFVDVAPNSHDAFAAPRPAKHKAITYKVVRRAGPPDSYKLPRPADVITPGEVAALAAEAPNANKVDANDPAPPNDLPGGAMGDWRRGRLNATGRRNPPTLHIA